MKTLYLLWQGIVSAFRKQAFVIILTVFTAAVAYMGFAFCFRTAFFFINQPQVTTAGGESGSELNFIYDAHLEKDTALNEKLLKILEFDGVSGMTLVCNVDLPQKNGSAEQIRVFLQYQALQSSASGSLSKEQIESGGYVILGKNYGYETGEKLTLGGALLEVIAVEGEGATVSFRENLGVQELNVSVFTSYQLSLSERAKVENIIGAKFTYGGVPSSMGAFAAVGIVLLLACGASIFSIYRLYFRKNDARYSLYKTLGAKNARIAAIMIGESLTFLLLGALLGLIIDTFLLSPMHTVMGVRFEYYAWEYLLLLFITAAVPLLMEAPYMVKKATLLPAAQKRT